MTLSNKMNCTVRFGEQFYESFFPLKCLGSRVQGSRAGTPVEVSENSAHNLLYGSFCHLVDSEASMTLTSDGKFDLVVEFNKFNSARSFAYQFNSPSRMQGVIRLLTIVIPSCLLYQPDVHVHVFSNIHLVATSDLNYELSGLVPMIIWSLSSELGQILPERSQIPSIGSLGAMALARKKLVHEHSPLKQNHTSCLIIYEWIGQTHLTKTCLKTCQFFLPLSGDAKRTLGDI